MMSERFLKQRMRRTMWRLRGWAVLAALLFGAAIWCTCCGWPYAVVPCLLASVASYLRVDPLVELVDEDAAELDKTRKANAEMDAVPFEREVEARLEVGRRGGGVPRSEDFPAAGGGGKAGAGPRQAMVPGGGE